VLNEVIQLRDHYGSAHVGDGKVVIIDFSAPNIAKPMSVGHLRSTIIGQAIYNIYACLGFQCIGDNHLGDWGTQFGNLIYAWQRWGDAQKLHEAPIAELLRVYVKFDEESGKDEAIKEQGRGWFKRLEDGDPEATELWNQFKDLSLQEFNRMYALLGSRFDLYLGESFYSGMLDELVADARAQGIASIDAEGKTVIPLDDHEPLAIQKSDGASLYATRDLATAIYRIKEYSAATIIYVVGSEQKAYFQQVFAALRKLGYRETKYVHVDFGLVRLPEGKMSTRKGRVVLLEDVVQEAIERAAQILAQTNPTLPQEEKDELARQIGIGAVKYSDLSQDRVKGILFDMERMLNLKGDSAPYLQYSYVRAKSITQKAGESQAVAVGSFEGALLDTVEERQLVKSIALFPRVIQEAAEAFRPNIIANYLLTLAERFHVFYHNVPVLRVSDARLRQARLVLVEGAATVIQNGLRLLGIECPQKM
jgi:arginyl-tRNA synthetase